MANAYSTAVAYNDYISPVNLALVNTVLSSKEQKYNANMAKIDSVLETYGNMDFYRDEDKQMMYENINVLLDSMQGLDKMSLSNPDTIRGIENSFKNAITPHLQKQLVNTAKIRSTFSMLEDMRKKNDAAYNEGNVAYMLENSGFREYASGETDSLGDMNYIPYYDIDKAIADELKVWAKDFGVTEDVVEDMVNHGGTTYAIRQISKETLSPDRVKQMIYSKLSRDPKAQQQVQINAWNKFNGLSDEEFTANYRAAAKDAEKAYSKTIAKIDASLKTEVEGSKNYRDLIRQKEEAILNRDKYKKIADSTQPLDRTAVANQVYIEELANGYANTYAFDRVTGVKYNDLPIRIAKEIRAEEKHALDKKKTLLEIQKLEGEVGTPQNPPSVGVLAPAGEPEAQKPIDELYTETVREREEEVSNLDALLLEYDPVYAGKETKEEKEAYIEELLSKDYDNVTAIDGGTGSIVMPPQEVVDAIQRVKSKDVSISNYTETVDKILLSKTPEFYEGIVNTYQSDPNKFRSLSTEEVTNMPTTMEKVREGKSWSELSDQDRAEITWESMNRVNTDIVGENDKAGKNLLKVGLKLAEERMKKYGGHRKKSEMVDEYDSPLLVSGLYGAGYALTGLVEGAGRGLARLVQTIITGAEPDIDKTPVSFTRASEEFSRAGRAWDNMWKTSETLDAWSNAEVDINGQSAEQYWKTILEASKGDTQSALASARETPRVGTSLTLNSGSDNKLEQRTAKELGSVASAYKQVEGEDKKVLRGWTLTKNAVVHARYNEDNTKVIVEAPMEIPYTDDKGTTKKIINSQAVEIPREEVPSSVINSLGSSQSNWRFSAKNPNKVTPTFYYKALPSTKESQEVIFNKLASEIVNSGVPEAQATAIAEMGSRRKTEWISMYSSVLDTDDKKNSAKDLLDSEFNVIFVGSEETKFKPRVDITYPSGETETVMIDNMVLDASVVGDVLGKTSAGVQAISMAIGNEMYKISQQK